MKYFKSICVLFALIGALQAKAIASEEEKLIDRVSVYAPADPNGYATKAFTFPPKGPMFSNHEITKIVRIDDGFKPEVIETTSGGVGSRHLSAIVTAEYGKPIASTFEIYGKPLFGNAGLRKGFVQTFH